MVNKTLAEHLLTEPTRRQVVNAISTLIEIEVRQTRGTRGLAMRRLYQMITQEHPDIIQDAVSELMDDWVGVLEPYYALYLHSAHDTHFDAFVTTEKENLGRELISVVKTRLQSSTHRIARLTRGLLSPRLIKQALPRLGRIVEHHTMKPTHA